jgi:hypothetical protein
MLSIVDAVCLPASAIIVMLSVEVSCHPHVEVVKPYDAFNNLSQSELPAYRLVADVTVLTGIFAGFTHLFVPEDLKLD